ncbi:Uncharacterized protein dnl_62460 [Desulfonema limicola]|uniref:Actin-like protein N-terminal domain-containing protein n=1 Tax=Desulfonema limicola TaxID=45656 RepID=A0A975BEH5_9BACT|nr:ParM/StbA family protein [Desulfonema limicola]QTA83828.1 Uncharacterized protein dnl_62460 [Desulfonema limicola]
MNQLNMGLDIGYGQVKAYLEHPDNKIIKIFFPRIFAEAQGEAWKELRSADIYGIDGDRYILGEEALNYHKSIKTSDARDYVLHNSYWACFGKVLVDGGIYTGNNEPIRIKRLVTGIAPGHFDRQIIRDMKHKIRNGVEITWNNHFIKFSAEKVIILPQGAGTFFEAILTDDGTQIEPGTDKLLHGILDFGHRTIDYVLFDGKEFISDPHGLSEDSGVHVILNKLLEYTKNHYGYKGQNTEKFRPVLWGEKFLCKGQLIDLSGPLKNLAGKHIRQIEQDAKKRWETQLDDMYKIILCGGGAHLFSMIPDFLNENKTQIIIPADPGFSNATGFFRFAKMQERLEFLKSGKLKSDY